VYCKKCLLLLLILFSCSIEFFGQEIVVNANNEPLNQVLTKIVEQYHINVSFDDKLLSKYKITQSATYSSPEDAVKSLIKNLPLEYENKDGVLIIYPKVQFPAKNKAYYLSGRVMDRISYEPLPYSHVIINGRGTVTDLAGSFAYSTTEDSIFSVKISHLGYYIVDTILQPGHDLQLLLTPSIVGLTEIEIKNELPETATQIGEQAGLMKLNNKIASFLPGFGDNSVFNLLRLQPGILASGEQTNELTIWGSYAGQSKVIFDGFTVYGLKNFNDNISAFNPMITKDMEVFKGGYDARLGERVGGIVNITGKNGNTLKPSFIFNINNMTISGLVEIPVHKTGSIVVAFRHTYYNLYNSEDMSSLFNRNNDADTTNDVEINVVPDYIFRDINIKYSTTIHKTDLFYISLYGGNDKFSYNFEEPYKNVVFYKETEEGNTQIGASAFYGKVWKKGNTSNFLASYSNLETQFSDNFQIRFPRINYINQRILDNSTNSIGEYTFENDNRYALNQTHRLEFGIGYKYNLVKLLEDTFNINMIDINEKGDRMNFYLQDNMALGKKVNLKLGARMDYAFNLNKFYFEPRASISVDVGRFWKINAAWGMYNQFITKSSVVDENDNYRYIWTICNNEDIPVLAADHYVLGLAMHKETFIFSLEAYYKYTTGLTRFRNFRLQNIHEIFTGKSQTYGADLMVKKDFGRHSAWVAYTLSKTEELFEYFKEQTYQRSPQDQRHELKLALLLNFDPFYFSSDYVYGSGFPTTSNQQVSTDNSLTYSRWDVSFIYKFLNKKLKGEVGISILNVLNTQNIKYASFERIPNIQTNNINIYTEAIPFTPTLYFKLSL